MNTAAENAKMINDPASPKIKKGGLMANLFRYKFIYLLMVPALVYMLIFVYLPILGIIIAFQDFDPLIGGFKSFFQSEWVGLEHFKNMFSDIVFMRTVLPNTFLLGALRLLFGFPIPIIFAILVTESRVKFIKKPAQTISYIPNLLSWVIVGGIFIQMFTTTDGLIKNICTVLNLPVPDLLSESNIRGTIIFTAIWKDFGAGAILFIAAIIGISSDILEAARIDGAGRMQRIIRIIIPSIMPVIMVLFIMNLSSMLNQSFEQTLIFFNDQTGHKIDIIDSYVYSAGIVGQRYSFATAVGLAKFVVSFTFIMLGNFLVRKAGYRDAAIF